MNTVELQTDLVQLINQVEDVEILQAMKLLLVKMIKVEIAAPTKYFEDLPDEVNAELEEAIKEADRGELTPTDVVMDRMKEKYNLAI